MTNNILDTINNGTYSDDYIDDLLSHLSNEHDEREYTEDYTRDEFEHYLYDDSE